MEIIQGYGLGSKIQRFLQRYWYGQKVVPKGGKYIRRPFNMEIGVSQGDPIYLTIFNIVVCALVRAALLAFCGPQ